jgi:protein-S-isoprenylcysteine O-methyltransferase Ste14
MKKSTRNFIIAALLLLLVALRLSDGVEGNRVWLVGLQAVIGVGALAWAIVLYRRGE